MIPDQNSKEPGIGVGIGIREFCLEITIERKYLGWLACDYVSKLTNEVLKQPRKGKGIPEGLHALHAWSLLHLFLGLPWMPTCRY